MPIEAPSFRPTAIDAMAAAIISAAHKSDLFLRVIGRTNIGQAPLKLWKAYLSLIR
jgi:hypothetical protein